MNGINTKKVAGKIQNNKTETAVKTWDQATDELIKEHAGLWEKLAGGDSQTAVPPQAD